MNKIEVKILNPEVIRNAEKMMVCAARLTQRGEGIKNLDDFMALYDKLYSDKTVENMVNLPHPTIQKFGVINVVIVGASRRFLAQITRHQNEVKYMSASCQYSDYSDDADFVIPYDLLHDDTGKAQYLDTCHASLNVYKKIIDEGANHDDAAYLLPQGLRNVLIISATPYQLKHMISQRTCRRNSTETRYVMLKLWEQLWNLSPMFRNCGPFCMVGSCKEGRMSCGEKMVGTPTEILERDFPELEVIKNEN